MRQVCNYCTFDYTIYAAMFCSLSSFGIEKGKKKHNPKW